VHPCISDSCSVHLIKDFEFTASPERFKTKIKADCATIIQLRMTPFCGTFKDDVIGYNRWC
jgi:hypothetical protein